MFSSPGPRVELLGNFLAKLAPEASEEEGGGAAIQVDQVDPPGAQDRRGLCHAQAAGDHPGGSGLRGRGCIPAPQTGY